MEKSTAFATEVDIIESLPVPDKDNPKTSAMEEIIVPAGEDESSKQGTPFPVYPSFLDENKQLDLIKCPIPSAAEYYAGHPNKESKIDLSGLSLILVLEFAAFFIYLFDVYAVVRSKALSYIHGFIVAKVKYLTEFAKSQNGINSLYHIHEKYDWNNPSNMHCLRYALRSYLVERGIYPKCSFDDDVWIISDMYSISDDRRAQTERSLSLRFDRIVNRDSVGPIKMYINYLIAGTTLSIEGNILQRLRHLVEFANILGDVSVLKASHDDIVKYIASLGVSKGVNGRASKVSQIREFYEFLAFKNMITETPITSADMLKKKPVIFTKRAVPDTVILQVFDRLPTLPEWAMVAFLCIICTGMRVGEALSLKRENCLKKSISINNETGEEKTKYSLCWYVSKTKSEPIHPIPDELGIMIEEYLRKTETSKSEYLFPSSLQITRPFSEKKFSDVMNKFMEKNEVRLPNGEIYHFKAHDWRHTFAAKMNEYGLTIYYISKALNHVNPEMTIHYVDNSAETAAGKIRNFFDKDGQLAPLKSVPKITDEQSVKDWMIKHGNARMVQDGFCDRSARLGMCSKNDGRPCITCEWYRTSVVDLDAHKARVEMLNETRKAAVECGNTVVIMGIDDELEHRKNIIKALEMEKSLESEQ